MLLHNEKINNHIIQSKIIWANIRLNRYKINVFGNIKYRLILFFECSKSKLNSRPNINNNQFPNNNDL